MSPSDGNADGSVTGRSFGSSPASRRTAAMRSAGAWSSITMTTTSSGCRSRKPRSVRISSTIGTAPSSQNTWQRYTSYAAPAGGAPRRSVETRGRGHERGRELGGVAQRPREIRVHARAARRAEVRVDLEAADAVLELGREGPPLVRRPEPVGRRRHRVVGGRERHRTEAAPAQAGRAVAPSRGRRAGVGREGRQQGDEDEDAGADAPHEGGSSSSRR